jgi:hypothetical protein
MESAAESSAAFFVVDFLACSASSPPDFFSAADGALPPLKSPQPYRASREAASLQFSVEML